MADTPNSTAQSVWNAALDERNEIIHNLTQNPNPQLDERLAQVEEQMLALAAPDIPGIVTKLQLLWSAELHGEDDESRHKQLVLSDLRRLTTA